MNKVAAVVVTYNRKDLLVECIEALISQSYKSCDIIVVDNASTDGTKELVNERFADSVIYVNTGSNLGGAGGFNYGMKQAYKLGYDYFWLMDDDCIVNSDTLTELMKTSDKLNDSYGFLSSRSLWTDGSFCKMNIPKAKLTKKIEQDKTGLQNIVMATFVSFLVRRKVVEAVGLPITDFFIWADDLEYSRRISRKYQCYFVYESYVTHKSKNNIGSNLAADNSDNLSRYRFAYRNEYYLFREEGFFGRFYYLLKRIYHRLKIVKSGDRVKEKFAIIKNAVKEGKRFYPQVEYVVNNADN